MFSVSFQYVPLMLPCRTTSLFPLFSFNESCLLKKGFGELEEKLKSQKKNGNRRMNLKDLSFLPNALKK